MGTGWNSAWSLSRKITRELVVTFVLLGLAVILTVWLTPEALVDQIPDITLRSIVVFLISVSLICGLYLIYKFRTEELKDEQFLHDTLKWDDKYLKMFRFFRRFLLWFFPIYLLIAFVVLLVRRFAQLHRLRKFMKENCR